MTNMEPIEITWRAKYGNLTELTTSDTGRELTVTVETCDQNTEVVMCHSMGISWVVDYDSDAAEWLSDAMNTHMSRHYTYTHLVELGGEA